MKGVTLVVATLTAESTQLPTSLTKHPVLPTFKQSCSSGMDNLL